ncbi:MAG: WhiB family redox-sensing transcriptional regulator [Glaciecola sp.]
MFSIVEPLAFARGFDILGAHVSISPLASVPPPQPWEDRAACRDQDPTLFFGPNRFEPKHERLSREAAAVEICRSCTVRRECLVYAQDASEVFGVWGGLTETDRKTGHVSVVA